MKIPTSIVLMAAMAMAFLPLFADDEIEIRGEPNPLLQEEMKKYEAIYTAILEENAMGRFFGIDSIIKGTVTPYNYELLNKLRDFERIPVGQRVIVFASKDGLAKLIAVIRKDGRFEIEINERQHRFRLGELDAVDSHNR